MGALNGKQIRIECPNLYGNKYYNYKEIYSLVLLAACDSTYCFISHDIGKFGRNNDSGIPTKIRSPLAHSSVPDLIENNSLDIPSPATYLCTFNLLL